ncbi:50S ribosomal protein L11 methyltransferase [Alcanivorax sp. HI0044]|nr:50S ribosomal protein L11 methyltransferase [Alcanivorax sp. HI0044]
MAEQAESVRAAYAPWFDLTPTTQQGDWVRIDGVRRVT